MAMTVMQQKVEGENPAMECYKPEAMWKYITVEECFRAHGLNPESAK
ncbi:hypothetical protein [Stygiolobus caldivivus]|uniref:Uncharacterized protein n=1 Tax=Stygiolobus caldivivus TaxID=2824673 RepID=A0A8D5ZIB0_9CREN|nr:hypothetical protein [Stygiolobus caldivivus]BCU69137.1 hypothetical protein KN1_04340 [Stygiolobus caldivivus]